MNDQQIQEKVRKILKQNSVTGYDKNNQQYHYIKPSKKRYPNQYFWDTCFHIFILTSLEEYDLAKRNIRSLFALQNEEGFVGHIIYWKDYLPHHLILPPRITDLFQNKLSLKGRLLEPHMSALIQPPLVAHAILHLYQADHDKEFLEEMLPKLKKYYRFLAANRDLDNTGLLTTISPFESGMDWKPTYDPVVDFPHQKANWKLFTKMIVVDFHNYLYNYNLQKIYEKEKFLVKDVCLNTIYIESLRALSMICEIMDDPEGASFLELAKKAGQSMVSLMYDQEKAAFLDVYGKENKKIDILAASIFFPLVMEEIDPSIDDDMIKKHFCNKEEFNTPYPVPSLAINDPAFYPKESMYIWRGPTWVVFNWYVHKYFLKKGYEKEAHHLISSIKKAIDKSGFREYYNPFTGEGYGAHDFTWAGLIVDMINKEKGKVPLAL